MTAQAKFSYPTVKLGSTGEYVISVQRTLNIAIDANLVVDGIFGSETEKAVKQFQKIKGLLVDGIVGPQTWLALAQHFED